MNYTDLTADGGLDLRNATLPPITQINEPPPPPPGPPNRLINEGVSIGEPKPKFQQHCAKRWADMATSALQWVRNIAAGISSPQDALENLEENLKHCQLTNDSVERQRARAAADTTPSTTLPLRVLQKARQQAWQELDLKWRDDPELCFAMGFNAGHTASPKVAPALTPLQQDAANLLFALHDAWPYVHGHCTINSVKNSIVTLMRKHGDFADLIPTTATEPNPPNLPGLAADPSAFVRWALKQQYDTTCHPLHFLFLNERTNAARAGWRAAVTHYKISI